MKKIYFIRHAKAVKINKDSEGDFDRELSTKGKEDIKLMGQVLKNYDMPDIIFSSTAKRCVQTAKKIAQIIKFKNEIQFIDNFYDIDLNGMLEFVKSIDNSFNNIYIISHNPTITQICEFISDSALDSLPTCAVFCVQSIEDDFKSFGDGNASVVYFDYPKKHR